MQTPPKTIPNPNSPTVEDISDNQQPNKQSSASIPSKEIAGEPTEIDIQATWAYNTTPDKGKSIEKTAKKENLTARMKKFK